MGQGKHIFILDQAEKRSVQTSNVLAIKIREYPHGWGPGSIKIGVVA
jgi:hypothetical protein